MDNQDKITNKIKNAAHKSEQNDFPGMEKVWARIDEKLDNQTLDTKTKLWKKIAVAASVLLVVSLAFQLAHTKKDKNPEEQVIATKDSIKEEIQRNKTNPMVSSAIDTTKINKTLNPANDSAEKNNNAVVMNSSAEEVAVEKEKTSSGSIQKNTLNKKSSFNQVTIYEARETKSKTVKNKATADEINYGDEPLVMVNGRMVRSDKYKSEKAAKKEISKNNDDEELETYTVLENLLYIINGVEYSEASLFGPNPTSPYAPLNKQIIDSFVILQNEEAVERYGAKGANGVAIITTKHRKPAGK